MEKSILPNEIQEEIIGMIEKMSDFFNCNDEGLAMIGIDWLRLHQIRMECRKANIIHKIQMEEKGKGE